MRLAPMREITGAFMFATTWTRPDLSFGTQQLAMHMAKPRLVHYKVAKRMLRYLRSTLNLGLVYRREEESVANLKLIGYSDADFAGEEDRKSTTGYCYMIGSSLITWRVVKQTCTALSTAESELVALTRTVQEGLWLMRLCRALGMKEEPITIYEDNQAAIILAKDNKFSERTKHMDVRYFFVRHKVQDGTVKVHYISTKDQLADFFTKPLGKILFQSLRARLGIGPCVIKNK
jgi:hypothetical protein